MTSFFVAYEVGKIYPPLGLSFAALSYEKVQDDVAAEGNQEDGGPGEGEDDG